MYKILCLLFVAIGSHFGFAFGRSLVSVRLQTGEWRAVIESARGHEYWLYPRPEIEAASWCPSCAQDNVVKISVRFWQQDLLDNARSALRRQRRCSNEQPCLVAPVQATRVVLRHPFGKWEALRPSLALSGVLPATVDFEVRPVGDENFQNDSAVPLQRLTSFEIDVFLAKGFARVTAESQQLVITNVDLKLALRLVQAKQNQVIDQSTLQKLAAVLLKIKARHLDTSSVSRPVLLAKLQQQLTTSSVEFRDSIKDLLPSSYRAKSGVVLFFLKQLGKSEQVSINIGKTDELRTLTVGVRLSRALVPPTSSGNDNELPTQKPYGAETSLLRQQVKKLASLAKAEYILDPAFIDLQAIDDCFDVRRKQLGDGVYYLKPLRRAVRCTADGFLVLLSRWKDSTNFNVTFREYEAEIGSVRRGAFFIGLKALSQVTLADDSCVLLKLYPWRLNVTLRTANYDSFTVSDSKDNYKLSYNSFQGTTLTDILSPSKGQMFSAKDRDNDRFAGNCAKLFNSGNWYASCQQMNMFGPYRPNDRNGMCSSGIHKSQGTMCSPLIGVKMLLRKKIHAPKSAKIVFSIIASPKKCKSTLKLFNITEPGLYTITLGGGPGGRHLRPGSALGGRGAKLTGVFHLEAGSVLALSAGCRGISYKDDSGNGGSASWAVLRPKGVLLGVAGGGGGGSYYFLGKLLPVPGMHGRASPEGGAAFWSPNSTETYDADSILNPPYPARGWTDVREKFLKASGGDVASGGTGLDWAAGGGGGFNGGHTSRSYGSGGGGGSFCNASEAKSCSVEEGGNTRPDGFVIVQRHFCF